MRNTPAGVFLEVQGEGEELTSFVEDIRQKAPPLAVITSIETGVLPAIEEQGFVILESGGGGSNIQIAPDCDVCPDCLRELFDPADRRFRYPFINCTNCGPRLTIIRDVPYDRANTSMACFALCPRCRAEYEDPANRRFHAEPNACPVCGPGLWITDETGAPLQTNLSGDSVKKAVELILAGHVLAIKGLGGFHLAVDATSEE
ncbi:carbamoyltransferase HypF, partial [bacterium]|nr:carbamoyltransferase HypF [bacterium]